MERIDPPGLTVPPGSYHQVVRAGDWVFVSGQIASAPDGSIVGVGDPAAQCEQLMNNLETALAFVGLGLDAIAKVTVFVVGREHLAAIRAVRTRRFGGHAPASSLVLVAGLAHEDALVEIEAVAQASAIGAG